MSCPKASYWKEVDNIGIESIMKNHTWKLIDLPHRSKPSGYKWIFKIKMKTNSTIDKYKARLFVKGYDNKKVWAILTHIHLYQE
jgi:hypothetical protein